MITEKILQVLTSADKTPFYLFDSSRFAENVRQLKSAFNRYYSNYSTAFSYKTNMEECVCRLAKSIGCYAEVVSPAEYEFAKSLWVDDKNIIYNGIIPDTYNKAKCAANGGKVNIDNLYELMELNQYAKENDITLEVGIRVFFEIIEGETSKFGFDINGDEFRYIVEHGFSNLHIVGLQCHISGHRDLDSWKERMRVMILLSKKFDIRYIDLGGNMYGNMDRNLRKQFANVPSYIDYANAVALTMKQEFPSGNVELITENGTSVIGDCVDVVSRIIGLKQTDTKELFICDTSMYDMGFLPLTKDVPYEVINTSSVYNQHTCDIVGNACTEEDVLVKGYSGRIEKGDYIVFRNLGAYSNALASDFIQPKPKFIHV